MDTTSRTERTPSAYPYPLLIRHMLERAVSDHPTSLIVYYGYIALIAFDKEFLAKPIGTGVTTLGIPIGVGVILFAIIITGIYVRRANTEFDALTEEILKEVRK